MKSEWTTYTVQELIDKEMLEPPMDGNHGEIHPKTTDYVKSGVPFIMANNLINGKVDYSNCSFITSKQASTLKKGFAHPGDVLLTHKATIGRTALVGTEYDTIILTPQVTYYRVKHGISNLYLKYYFDSNEFQQTLDNWAGSGSTRAYLGITAQRKLPVVLPPFEIQTKIAEFGRILDDKIELNNKVNENLEQQAQALYRHMFIENPSSEWEEGTLNDIADITMGQSPSGSSYNENGEGTIFFQGRAEFGFRFPSIRLYTTEPKHMARANDVLMSVRAPVGDLNVAHTDCCIGRGLAAIHSKTGHQSFVLYTMFALKDQLNVFNGEGTVFGSINRNSLNDMPILIPSSDSISAFEDIVTPIDAAIRNNYNEICRLTQLRDSILPKLMSGELDVSSLDF